MVAGLVAWSAANPVRPGIIVQGGPTYVASPTQIDHLSRHTWTVRNTSRVPIKLRTRFTSGRCGFSLWIGREVILPPDGEMQMSLTWPSPIVPAIPYTAFATILTSDPNLPKLRLKVVGITAVP